MMLQNENPIESNSPLVAVIILNYKNYTDTIDCITSLKESSFKGFDIIVVDNNSGNESESFIRRIHPDIHVVANPENRGYAAGMNTGIRYALNNNYEYFLLTNNDVVFEHDFLGFLLTAISRDGSIGMVSPKIVYYSNPKEIYCAGADFIPWKCVAVNHEQHQNAAICGNVAREITSAEGCTFLVKRTVFEKVKMINEDYFMYFEDLDFSLKIRKQGFCLWYEPRSLVYHKVGGGTKLENYSLLYHYYFTRNRLLFCSQISIVYFLYGILFSFFVIGYKMARIVFSSEITILLKMKVLWKLTVGFGDGLQSGIKRLASRWF